MWRGEAYISNFKDELTSLKQEGENTSDNLREMTFLNEVFDDSGALLDILMKNNSKTYENCNLSLRKKAVDIENNMKGNCPLRQMVTVKYVS